MPKDKWYIGRRAELLAELALQEIFPNQLLRAESKDFPFDYMVAVPTNKGTKMLAVEVKGTERPVEDKYTFHMTRRNLERLRQSTTPTLFLVANVKEDHVYYGWSDEIKAKGKGPIESIVSMAFCVLPVSKLTKSEHAKIRQRVLS